jgi:hypothetical protein
VKALAFLAVLVSLVQADDWQVGAQAMGSFSGVNFKTVLDTPYNTAGFRPNMGIRPGFSVRYKNYGLALTPALSGESQRYESRPPTLFTDFKLSFYQPEWGVDLYYQYYRGYAGTYGDSTREHLDFPGMRQTTLMANVYGSILSFSGVMDPENLIKFRRGKGIAYFTETIPEGTGLHVGLFYLLSGFHHDVTNSGTFFPDALATGSYLDHARRMGITGASGALGFTLGGGFGDRNHILGRFSDGAALRRRRRPAGVFERARGRGLGHALQGGYEGFHAV